MLKHLIETKAVLDVEYLSVRGLSDVPRRDVQEAACTSHPELQREGWEKGALKIVDMLVESKLHAPWGWGGE